MELDSPMMAKQGLNLDSKLEHNETYVLQLGVDIPKFQSSVNAFFQGIGSKQESRKQFL